MEKKKVLFVSQSIQQQFYDVIKKSLKDVSDYDIITADIKDNKTFSCPKYDKTTIKTRIKSWILFFFYMMKWMRKNSDNNYSLVFASSNPPINIWIGLKLKEMYDCPFIFTHWDIHPQGIQESFSNKFVRIITKIWQRWNEINYPKVDLMLANGPIAAEYIKCCTNAVINIQDMPFGVNTDELYPRLKAENKFCVDNGLENKFVLLYSGTMGMHHDIETILEAAQILEEYRDIVFVFIGAGVKECYVRNYINEHPNGNVRLFPLQTKEMFPFSMSCADIGIVSQDEIGAKLQYPSKVFSYMACGEAILGIGEKNSDLYQLLKEHQIGEFSRTGAVDQLVSIILKMYKETTLLNGYKVNSRKVAESMSIDKVAEEYKKMFQSYL